MTPSPPDIWILGLLRTWSWASSCPHALPLGHLIQFVASTDMHYAGGFHRNLKPRPLNSDLQIEPLTCPLHLLLHKTFQTSKEESSKLSIPSLPPNQFLLSSSQWHSHTPRCLSQKPCSHPSFFTFPHSPRTAHHSVLPPEQTNPQSILWTVIATTPSHHFQTGLQLLFCSLPVHSQSCKMLGHYLFKASSSVSSFCWNSRSF